jgi:hypothetical protein
MPNDKSWVRVLFMVDNEHIELIPFGMDSLDLPSEGVYPKDDIPAWIQDKLSALSILPTPPPENNVEGVGKRISDRVFWVYPD